MSEGPLAGVQVLDLSLNLPGPYATSILASLGATVIKIEPPRGDPARGMGDLFELVNRGKQSVVLDLKGDPHHRAALAALAARADVLVEGFRPGVMSRLGLSPEAAMSANPRLVWCSISAYGATGPRASAPAHDLNAQALTGLCWLERDAADRPRPTVLPSADLATALCAVAAINAALFARASSGEGAFLDAAMIDPAASFAWIWSRGVDPGRDAAERTSRLGRALGGPLLRRLSRERLYALPHYGVFRCRDDKWLAIGIVDEDRFWAGLCRVLGLPAIGRLRLPARTAIGPLLRPVVSAAIRTRTREAWLARLASADLPVTSVLDPTEAAADPHIAARGCAGISPVPGSRPHGGDAPALGAHTEGVLAALGAAIPNSAR